MSNAFRTRQARWLCLAGWLAATPLPAWAGGAGSPARPVTLATQETPLGTFPDNVVTASVTVDPTGRRVAYAVHRGAAGLPPLLEAVRGSGTMAAVVDGRKGKPYALIDGPFFSPDGRRAAYVGMSFRELAKAGGVRTSQERARIVLDGVEGKAYDEIRNRQFPEPDTRGERPVFSPDGARLAYVARVKKTWRVVVDGREDKTCDGVRKGSLRFSPDGGHYAYAATRGENELLVLDGAEAGGYDEVSVKSMVFSPDSSRVAFAARREGKALVVTRPTAAGAKATETVTPLLSAVLSFSPDGKHRAYIIRSDGGERIVLDGRALAPYEKVRPPVFAPRGGRFGFLAQRGGRRFAVVDGKAQPGYDDVYLLHFSPDGKRFAYVGSRADQWCVVVDGKAAPPCDGIMVAETFFSPDGKRVAYVAQRGKKRTVVVDGVAGPPHEAIMDETPLFSPDGKRVAYAAFAGKKVKIVLDGKGGREYDGVSDILFSPDGRHLAYIARRGKQRLVVVGAAESRPCDYFLGEAPLLTFDGPDCLHALAGRAKQYFRVRVKIAPAPTARK